VANGEREPTALVGAPGATVGSAGDGVTAEGVAGGTTAGVDCSMAAFAGMLAITAPPNAPAAPAISWRRETVLSEFANGRP